MHACGHDGHAAVGLGVAAVLVYSGADEAVDNSPTITAAMTGAGVILGTAAYMSPEQARGKEVDRRTDIWAFGVILFELLTGQQLFKGETAGEGMVCLRAADGDTVTITVRVTDQTSGQQQARTLRYEIVER